MLNVTPNKLELIWPASLDLCDWSSAQDTWMKLATCCFLILCQTLLLLTHLRKYVWAFNLLTLAMVLANWLWCFLHPQNASIIQLTLFCIALIFGLLRVFSSLQCYVTFTAFYVCMARFCTVGIPLIGSFLWTRVPAKFHTESSLYCTILSYTLAYIGL